MKDFLLRILVLDLMSRAYGYLLRGLDWENETLASIGRRRWSVRLAFYGFFFGWGALTGLSIACI